LRPEEKQNNIIKMALEIMKRSGTGEEPAITFDQALKIIQVEQIWRIASIAHQIRIAIDDLTEEITEDISGSPHSRRYGGGCHSTGAGCPGI